MLWSSSILRQRYKITSQQDAFRSSFEAFPNQLRVRSPAAGFYLLRQQNAVGIRPLEYNRRSHGDGTHLHRLPGVSTRQYSTSHGTPKRSFLFDEPPIQGNQASLPKGTAEEIPSVERDVVETKDAETHRDVLQDPFGKGSIPRSYLGALTMSAYSQNGSIPNPAVCSYRSKASKR